MKIDIKLAKYIPLGYLVWMQTVAETPSFVRQAEKLLSEDEKKRLISFLASHPQDGDLIEGTGGVRKLRFAVGGRGKSGGVRVIYYYFDETIPLYALLIYGKNEMSDLSGEQRRQVAALAEALKASARKEKQ